MVFYSSHTYRIKKHSCDRRPRRSGPYVECDVVVPALALVMVFNGRFVFFFKKFFPPPPFRSHVVSTRTRDTTTDGHRNPTVTWASLTRRHGLTARVGSSAIILYKYCRTSHSQPLVYLSLGFCCVEESPKNITTCP